MLIGLSPAVFKNQSPEILHWRSTIISILSHAESVDVTADLIFRDIPGLHRMNVLRWNDHNVLRSACIEYTVRCMQYKQNKIK